jgi:hypothetical protein
MRFWDTSALLPLLLEEPRSAQTRDVFEADPEIVVWWGTPVECWSALARLGREKRIGAADEDRVGALLDRLQTGWIEILPGEEVRTQAIRMLRVHGLRALDAFQLAAAMVWAGTPAGDGFVTFDRRLATAARAEGFIAYPSRV